MESRPVGAPLGVEAFAPAAEPLSTPRLAGRTGPVQQRARRRMSASDTLDGSRAAPEPIAPPVAGIRSGGNALAVRRSAARRPDLGPFTLNVMAPLVIGDPRDLDGPASQAAWRHFDAMLRDAKAHGAECVSTDVWWGLVEREDNVFDWAYYERIADAVARAGLAWIPILSFHQCGGNVGDDAHVPLPGFLQEKYAALSKGGEGPFFVSEQGNVSREAISPWASRAALQEFDDLMRAFQTHFAGRAELIQEVIISLGPAGELRYPSYNAHDQNTDYPSRGALQAYSHLALESFRAFALQKYGDLQGVGRAWGITLRDKEQIRPPSQAGEFFARGHDKSLAYGRDFFDWYNASLVEHGRTLLTRAVDIFNAPGAPFLGIDVGGKIPGVHWRLGSDRAAELAAGLIRSSEARTDWLDDAQGRGYDDLVRMFRDVGRLPHAPKVVLHFTCLEMEDGGGGPQVASLARSLVGWVRRVAQTYGVPIKGENALGISQPREWQNIKSALRQGFEGLTTLRLPLGPDNLRELRALADEFG